MDDRNFPDPGIIVGDARIRARKISKEDVIHIVEAVAVTTQMIIIRNPTTHEFQVLAPPETVLDAMTRSRDETR